jgi:hypothetical protein
MKSSAEGDHPQVAKAPGYNLEALSGLKISHGEAFITSPVRLRLGGLKNGRTE